MTLVRVVTRWQTGQKLTEGVEAATKSLDHTFKKVA